MTTTYTIGVDHRGYDFIKCHRCGFTSFSMADIKHKYCGKCHEYHEYPFLSEEKNLEWLLQEHSLN